MFLPGIQDHCCYGVFETVSVFTASLKIYAVMKPPHPGLGYNPIKRIHQYSKNHDHD